MNKEKLFSVMPVKVVSETELNKTIEEQRGVAESGNRFVSQLSINRYLDKKLADFSIEERLNLFSELKDSGFAITGNELYLHDVSEEDLAQAVAQVTNALDVYHVDNAYVESLANGKDFARETVIVNDEPMTFANLLPQLVFSKSDMPVGDSPHLSLMLVVKKALIGSYLAEQNVEALLQGKREIKNVSILF